MEQKKKSPTKGQLEMRIKNALVFIPRDKDYVGIYFSDKGLRLEVTQDHCVISTGFHRHVFDAITSSGVSRPWIYTKRVIEIATENLDAIAIKDKKGNVVGYSFQKLLEVLGEKENKSEYNIVTFYEWWCRVIFDGLYSISEDAVGQFLVYFKYLGIIATNAILLEEHKEDMTNKQFVENFIKNIKDFTGDMDEHVLFHALSDEERMKQEIEAMAATEQEQMMEGQADGVE
jgi:hypothetical protein